MSKIEKYRHMQQILDEIQSSEGLPENLSTEAQLWDEILKKEAFLMPEQLFPLIKEIHGKDYPMDTPVKPLATEYSIERGDTKKISSIRADITIVVAEYDIYHFECEIKNDHTMVLRMFEYDAHIALSYRTIPNQQPNGNRPEITLRFPHSAVLYLEDNGSLPKELSCTIHFQDGSSHIYKIPTIRVQSYSLEYIQKKHLCVLIPFLPLRFRKKQGITKKEELTSFYQELILILDKEVEDGYLSETNRKAILSLLGKSMIRVFYRDKTLLKEVVRMTEPILELEFEKTEKLEKYYKRLVADLQAENKKQQAENEALKRQLAELQKL